MRTVVRPDAPIIVGFSLRVFAVLIVQEGDNLVQHGLGHRKPCAEFGPSELKGEVGADALVHNEILETRSRPRARVIMKLDAFVDALVNCFPRGRFEMGLSETLADFEVSLVE